MPPKAEYRRDPSAVTAVRDFFGLVTNGDPHDIPVGAATVMVNATPVVPGQLTVRRGTRIVLFDSPGPVGPPVAPVPRGAGQSVLADESGNFIVTEDGSPIAV